jgi:hypothetical protein
MFRDPAYRPSTVRLEGSQGGTLVHCSSADTDAQASATRVDSSSEDYFHVLFELPEPSLQSRSAVFFDSNVQETLLYFVSLLSTQHLFVVALNSRARLQV